MIFPPKIYPTYRPRATADIFLIRRPQAKVNTHDTLVVRLLRRPAYSPYRYVCKMLSDKEINDSYLILSYLFNAIDALLYTVDSI